MTHTAAKIIIKIQIKFFLVVDFIVFPLFLQLYIKPYHLLHLVKTRNLN